MATDPGGRMAFQRVSREDLVLLSRAVEDSRLLRTLRRTCNDYLHDLRPDGQVSPHDLAITVSPTLKLYVRRSGSDMSYNGARQLGLLRASDGRKIWFMGERDKGLDRGIVGVRLPEGHPAFEETQRLMREFDEVIHKLEEDERDDEGPDDRKIAEHFSNNTIKLGL